MSNSVQQLLENPRREFLEASEILLKYANNILMDPANPKYRRVRVSNQKVQEILLRVGGAIECLFEMGFVEDGEYFSMPIDAPLLDMERVKNDLERQRKKIVDENMPLSDKSGKAASVSQVAGATTKPSVNPASELAFYQKLRSSFDHVLIYEDASLQRKAKKLFASRLLHCRCREKLKENHLDQSYHNDLLLLEVLAWFKQSFFRWVDQPACVQCKGKTVTAGHANPTQEELAFGGGRVENYKCTVCSAFTRFPRYNHPGKLLETKAGRCGEWANCFTLICRALGFDARYVLDWTDHVWTEVFSEKQNAGFTVTHAKTSVISHYFTKQAGEKS